jgi:uncharacterized protein YndB with AHSA1/START domain
MTEESREIEQRYYFDASPKKVFKALTSPKRLAKWFLQEAKIEPEAGTKYEFVWRGGHHHEGKVLAVDPGRKLTLSWPQRTAKKELGNTTVTFELRERNGGALLSLTHSGFGKSEEWIQTYALTSSGWAYYLTNLKSVLENGTDLRRREDEF